MSVVENIQNVRAKIAAAAEKSGFPDYSHFISLFKRRFGITPKKYQKR